MKLHAMIAGTGLLLFGSKAFAAQETTPPEQPAETSGEQQGVLVYPPSFFASASPNTALDMVQRIPGFGLDTGNSGARGLAGAAGNVLIDGDRPTSKSDSLDEVLRRIPASSVERVELIRGGAPGIDMQGRSVVANVVLKKTSTEQITAEANVYAYTDAYFGPQLRLQYSKQKGEKQTEAAIFATTDRTGGTADGRRTRYDAAGSVIQEADLDLWDRLRNVNARGTLQRRVAGGKLRLNGLADFHNMENRQLLEIVSGAGTDDRTEDEARTISGEFGVNWTRPLSATTEIELTGLQRGNLLRFESESLNAGGQSTFDIDSTSGESIARSILRFRPSKAWAFEGGGEVAYNFLDSTTAFTQGGTPVPLPNASVFVSELRGEAFGQATWQASPKLTAELGLRVEVSRISQSGDTEQSKSFLYPKPRAQLTWRPAANHQLRLRAQKEVSQLNFSDFVASTEVNLGTVIGGNADLEPQKDLILEAVYEHRFWKKGVFELTAQHREVDDIIDIIPLVGGFEAVGNIGSGTRDMFQARLTLPLDRLGLKNGLLQARGSWFWSEATDPLTGEKRRFSGEVPFGCGIAFSQDLKGGRFSYGFDHGCNVDRFVRYRVREVRRQASQPYVSAYGQWKPAADLTIRLEFGNLTNAESRVLREIYDGPRNTAPLLRRELRQTRQGEWLFLQVRKIL
ncbi:MAG TPA: TonB-dependent receptor [Allosphingosinicella sp.]|jgi:hypothetical protein